jgi:hypothetical protein
MVADTQAPGQFKSLDYLQCLNNVDSMYTAVTLYWLGTMTRKYCAPVEYGRDFLSEYFGSAVD